VGSGQRANARNHGCVALLTRQRPDAGNSGWMGIIVESRRGGAGGCAGWEFGAGRGWGCGRAEDAWTVCEGCGDREVVADMEDTAGEGSSFCAVLVFEGTDLFADFVDGDVVAEAGVRLGEAVHGKE
jgi:hypothetical protein